MRSSKLMRLPFHVSVSDPLEAGYRPWPALWALCLGFFMILVDTTIVSVATPAIMTGLGGGVDDVVWVTSAYLLAYAVPLLITGRLEVGEERQGGFLTSLYRIVDAHVRPADTGGNR